MASILGTVISALGIDSVIGVSYIGDGSGVGLRS